MTVYIEQHNLKKPESPQNRLCLGKAQISAPIEAFENKLTAENYKIGSKEKPFWLPAVLKVSKKRRGKSLKI